MLAAQQMRLRRYVLITFLCGVTGCMPMVVYSGKVQDPRRVDLVAARQAEPSEAKEPKVLLPAEGPPTATVIASEEAPLNGGPTVVGVTRLPSGAIEADVINCPLSQYDTRLTLVSERGDLPPTEDRPKLAREHGVLSWPTGSVDDFDRPVACTYKGTLEVPVANVTFVTKTTTGRRGAGILSVVVGSLMMGGGTMLTVQGLRDDHTVPVAIGAPTGIVGLMAVGLGLYHLLLPTTTERLELSTGAWTDFASR